MPSEFVSVIECERLKPETGRTVEVKGRRFAVFHSGGEFFAIDDTCPHVGASLGDGFCEGGVAHCPLHGWTFDLKTGACLSNPRKPVNTYPTRVVDGWLQIEI
ncbi:MAG: Rieske (2Fe-2S) protein [Limisphaerales bacterium]